MAVVAAATSCSTATGGQPAPPVTEDLTFTGAVAGALHVGSPALTAITTNPVSGPLVDSEGQITDPAPTATVCSTFAVSGLPPDYVAVITGDTATTTTTTPVALTVEINQDRASYTSPGTVLLPGDVNDGGSVMLYRSDSNQRWQQVVGPDGQTPAQIVLAPDRRSGHLDAWLGDTAYSQKSTIAEVHVDGDWRCG